MIRPAIRLYPARWPATQERERALASVENVNVGPFEIGDLGDPPADGLAHWEAVWRAAHAAHTTDRDEPQSWEDEQREMTALAKTLGPVGVPIERDECRLIALLPPPPELGSAWVAVYLHPKHRALAIEASREANERNHPGVHVERVSAAAMPAIYHVAAKALVPVERVPFMEIHPHFFVETAWTDEQGSLREWHEADDFAQLPTTPEAFILAQQFHYGTKIGGFPISNADDVPLSSAGTPMRYAYQLSADFFDVEFGDAGSLHVWLSPSTAETAAMTSSA
jgi:hypothetical protein